MVSLLFRFFATFNLTASRESKAGIAGRKVEWWGAYLFVPTHTFCLYYLFVSLLQSWMRGSHIILTLSPRRGRPRITLRGSTETCRTITLYAITTQIPLPHPPPPTFLSFMISLSFFITQISPRNDLPGHHHSNKSN
jgi:hypothetical protein